MELKDKLIKRLRELIKIQIYIGNNGGPEENGELFDEYLQIRADILRYFGLPHSDIFGNIFSVSVPPTDVDIEIVINRLKQTAAEYLLAPVRTEIKALEEAIDLQLDYKQVFLELGITPHIYTIFIYEKILLTRYHKPEAVLEALRVLRQEPELLNLLGKLSSVDSFGEEERGMIETLKYKGIQYVDQYLLSLPANKKGMVEKTI